MKPKYLKVSSYAVMLLTLIAWTACRQPEKSQEAKVKPDGSPYTSADYLDEAQMEFVLQFNPEPGKPVYMLSKFKNRYFNKVEQKEVTNYFSKSDSLKKYLKELTIDRNIEKYADTTKAHSNLIWISDEDVYTCQTVVRDLWPCLKNRFPTNSFYYLSAPIISSDGKYALMNVNYVSEREDDSYGGACLFEKRKGRWVETALFSRWGKMPE